MSNPHPKAQSLDGSRYSSIMAVAGARPTPYQARPELYRAFSVVDEAKGKAARGVEKASVAAQAKTGGIELYSAKFYAACTVGGLLACVSGRRPEMAPSLLIEARVSRTRP